MIYVLFGPPGVGKTYIGGLLAKEMDWHFFDADSIYMNDDGLRYLLASGNYDQKVRDKFVTKLMMTVEHMLVQYPGKNLIIAEAFTKEKNRREFLRHFDEQVMYVMIHTSRELALKRMRLRKQREEHVVDERIFEFVWDEFETPQIPHLTLQNVDKTDRQIMSELKSLLK